ncbi:MAG: hypothetical protein IJM92_04635 [Fibrobacter sp.]|uniref:hypothetical protein n=1 Tax=Fibrobacter sp. TaxID=35828 RepID=UPI0025BE5DCA|nr:hypothetical protein [Fibrobacter sp.]MBQ7078949.1 hypothetical protein [Fibrobacter sp.]
MREIFRVSKNLPKDSILWKFFSVERLLELIAKHGLYFTKTEYQQDPSEGFSVFEQIEHNPSNFGDESDLYDEIITIYNYIENNERLVTSLLEGLSAQVELDQLKNSYKGNEQNDIFNKEELSEDEKIDFLRLFFEQLTLIIQGEFHYIDALIDKWKKVNPSVYTIFKADQINHGLNELLKNISRPFVTRREYENAKKELKKSSYLCCFNKGNTINDLLWSYSKGNYGVAIETSIEKIKQNMERKKIF